MDLPGINKRYNTRLKMAHIFNPIDFLNTDADKLKKVVFKGIVGYYWYMRLRGYEVDDVNYGRKSFGSQYALSQKTDDKKDILKYLMKLSEKAGRRLRMHGYQAGGIHLSLSFEDHGYFSKGTIIPASMYATQDIFYQAKLLLDESGKLPSKVTNMSVKVFNLTPMTPLQLGLFNDSRLDSKSLAHASDLINDRYGEFTLSPAIMANMQDVILKRIAFGNVSDYN